MKLSVKNARGELLKSMEHLRLRPHDVLKLLYGHIDRRRPAFRNKGATSLLKERFKRLLQERYPDAESGLPEETRQGSIPKRLLEAMEESMQKQSRQSGLADRNQTPAEPAQSPDDVFKHATPHAIWAERSSNDQDDGNEQTCRALDQCSELQVQTGSEFVDQW